MAKGTNMSAFGLKLVGSLIYLYVLWSLWSAYYGAPSDWQAILLGIGAVLSVSFFLVTLASLQMNSKDMAGWSMKTEVYGGISLFALAAVAGNAGLGWAVLLGFVLSSIGSGMEK
ncbi:MAG: hypothetical protein KGI00_02350 [Candidatus Micrarchaeota archaeon]|nr:hypothetical protein [Candidatus Micrarchaeota archaeon]MDE1823753.1 hypothetical protein [Candidatus Micrarchaeota archaeon]MDE1849550.1 hypothetical protein [Candidatus Micrarchaeota archaeon]